MTIHDTILGAVGRTPVVRLNRLAPAGVDVFLKLEAFNPLGSVKDRLALGIIEAAERDGSLKPGQTVIEATSGNTGIGLAMVCASKGYPLVVVMAENFSVERRKLMRFLGAKVVLTPAAERGSGMLAKAAELAEKHGWFLCRQFENEAGAAIHAATTGPEILADFAGRRLDYWVTGTGTGGTLKGVASVLRKERPETKIVVCEPDNAQMLASRPLPDWVEGAAPASHPDFRPHPMQGWSPDFVPKLTGDAIRAGWADMILPVSGDEALQLARDLALKEGVFCGITAGATLAGGLAIARTAPEGTTILCMAPDTGERYLSTPLFAHISGEMSGEEIAISRSTPRARFDAPPAPGPKLAQAPAPVTQDAARFVEEAIGSKTEPVVMFALEWCEFCWSVRRLFAAAGISFRAIDLDSAALQKDGLGGDVRAALKARIGAPTIPQIFIGGELVGGCTEVFDAFEDGSLFRLLARHGVMAERPVVNAKRFLPQWIEPRREAS